MDKKIPIIFGIAAIFCVIVAFIIYKVTTSASEVVVNKSTTSDKVYYEAVLDKPGWADTGIWVAPDYMVTAASFQEPYTLQIDSSGYDEAALKNLKDGNFFIATVTTTTLSLPQDHYAQVDKQGKIYLYSEKSQKITFAVRPLDSSQKEYLARLSEEYNRKFYIVIGVIVSLIIIGVSVKGYFYWKDNH
jgi:hypothetical protein